MLPSQRDSKHALIWCGWRLKWDKRRWSSHWLSAKEERVGVLRAQQSLEKLQLKEYWCSSNRHIPMPRPILVPRHKPGDQNSPSFSLAHLPQWDHGCSFLQPAPGAQATCCFSYTYMVASTGCVGFTFCCVTCTPLCMNISVRLDAMA